MRNGIFIGLGVWGLMFLLVPAPILGPILMTIGALTLAFLCIVGLVFIVLECEEKSND